MIVKEVAQLLQELAPLQDAEEFDNVGILVGNENNLVTGILISLDALEQVVDEAIAKDCNLIVSFHPIIFEGLKKLTGATYVERTVIKALKNNISIYSMHTALDNARNGVNTKICKVLGIKNTEVLIPKKASIRKLVTYVPKAKVEDLSNALFAAGAGNIGNYSNCSFRTEGLGSFKPGKQANPTVGAKGEVHFEEEIQLHITYVKALEKQVLSTLHERHPYEEVAYEVYRLENTNQHLGMGRVGNLDKTVSEEAFLKLLKERMHSKCVRHSQLLGKPVKRVAVLGGSGAFGISAALASGADMYVTSDLKYHQFYQAEEKMVLVDIGHYESEQFTKNLLYDYLTEKIPNFAISLSESITNPIKYY